MLRAPIFITFAKWSILSSGGESFAFARNVEDILGDMRSVGLTRKFPKWTSFHDFIENVILSVIYEDADKELVPGRFWVDYLLSSNDMRPIPKLRSRPDYEIQDDAIDGYTYLDDLAQRGLIDQVCESVTKQVFHVLFANRGTLAAFWAMASFYVQNSAPSFSPDAFSRSGALKRARPPEWARSSIFHRDKGRCVICTVDLTRLINQQSSLHYDHIVPLAEGGGNCVTNLQLLCSSCNTEKGAKLSGTSEHYDAWYQYDF